MAQNERRDEGNGRTSGGRGEARGGEREQRRGEEPQRAGGLARSGGASSLGREGGFGYGGAGPFSFARRMLEDMDRLFGEIGVGGVLAPFSGGQPHLERGGLAVWAPQLEVFEEGDQLVVRADLPGLKREDVNVDLQDDMLVISGERRDEKREEREGFFRSERSYGRFERALRVPEGTDPSSCEARFDNGVLEVRLKMPEQQQRGRRIPIQASGETVSEKPASKKGEKS